MKQTHLPSGLHALLWKEEKLFVAKCVEVRVASQGKNKKEALHNLQEALELYFEGERAGKPESLSNLELLPLSGVQYA